MERKGFLLIVLAAAVAWLPAPAAEIAVDARAMCVDPDSTDAEAVLAACIKARPRSADDQRLSLATAAALQRVGRWDEAIDRYRTLIRRLNFEAGHKLGLALFDENNPRRDPVEAVLLWRWAADGGHPVAQHDMGWLFYHGRFIEKDWPAAYAWYEKGAAQGFAASQYSQAYMLRYGQGVASDYGEAAALFRLSADQGNTNAMRMLAGMYDLGVGVPLDNLKNYVWLRKAVAAGNGIALLELAPIALGIVSLPFEAGRSDEDAVAADEFLSANRNIVLPAVKRSSLDRIKEASDLLHQAIDRNVPGARLAMANLHVHNDPMAEVDLQFTGYVDEPPRNRPFVMSASRAAELYEHAINEGSVAAKLNLARLKEFGHGVPRDLEGARALYAQADEGVFEGPAKLGMIRHEFAGVWDDLQWRLDRAGQKLGDKGSHAADAVVVKPISDFVHVSVTDAVGRRQFVGALPAEGYVLPDDADGLILWYGGIEQFAEKVRIEVGGRVIRLPEGRDYGIRLDTQALRQGDDFVVRQPDDFHDPRSVPAETRSTSRITLVGRTPEQSVNIYVATADHLIGFAQTLYENAEFHVPNAEGLTLDLRAEDRAAGKPAVVDVMIDGRKHLVLTAGPGCMVKLELSVRALLEAKHAATAPADCAAMGEDTRLPIISDPSGQVLATLSRTPDESIPGVFASFMPLARTTVMMNMVFGGQWDQLLRARRIDLTITQREQGPNGPDVLTARLNLINAEVMMGNMKTAQVLLEDAIARIDGAGYIPDRTRAELYVRASDIHVRLGNVGMAEEFLILAHAYQRRHNRENGEPPFRFLTRIYGNLADLSASLHRYDDALAYALWNFALGHGFERSESFSAEAWPGALVEIVQWLNLTGRSDQAGSLYGYLHKEAKRDIVRDAPEPLVFPLNLKHVENALGEVDRSSNVAGALEMLAEAYGFLGRFDEAVPLFRQGERTSANLFGGNSPQATAAAAKIADAQRGGGHLDDELATARRAWVGAELFAATREAVRQEASSAPISGMVPAGLALLEALSASDHAGSAAEAFGVAQRLHSSSTALAMLSQGERLQLESAEARSFLRRRQDLAERLVALDRRLASVMTRIGEHGTASVEADIRQEILAAEMQMSELGAQRPPEVVQIDQLSRSPTLSGSQISPLLGEDELLVNYLVLDEASFAWTLDRAGSLAWFRVPANGVKLEGMVGRFRSTLGPVGIGRGARPLARSGDAAFDQVEQAHKLYQALIAPLAEKLKGKRQVTVVANGVLTSLPFHALVSAPPDPRAALPWREARWLVRDYAISLMPSAASIDVVKRPSARTKAQSAYLGIGDPILGGGDTDVGTAAHAPAEAVRVAFAGTRGLSDYSRGGVANIELIRELPRLADTAIELRAVSRSLAAEGKAELLLGAEATETRLKQLSLSGFRVIHFATHGLVSGDIQGLAEPALVMTPPASPSVNDDGLLTASEIARLELNAGWVILSACNTASAERPEAEALSGLARAFFYAGARSVLVSHWPVVSSAAVKLTTRTFEAMAADESIGRAEALRRSMLNLIDNGSPAEADPSYWAPFVVVGEGEGY